jgi:MFS family permease
MSKGIDVKWPIITINLVVATDILGFMLILPIIDVFSQHLGASKRMIGLQITLYAVSAMISSFMVGKISDRFGRKTIFLISAFGSFLTSLACIFITTFTQFLVFSALSGFFSGTIGTAYAYIGDIVHEEKKRSKYIAWVTATISCCLVLGPLLGGILSSVWTLRAPFIIGSGIACIEFIFVLRYLKNPNELLQSQHIRLLSKDVLNTFYENNHKESFQSDEIKSNQLFMDLNYYHRTSFSEIVLTDPSYTYGEEKEYKFKTAIGLPARKDNENNESEQLMQNPVQANSSDPAMPAAWKTEEDLFPPEQPPAQEVEKKRSPWMDYRAILIGGLGTFFNSFTYLGLVTLMPLILQEHKYGIVNDDDNADGHDNNDDSTDLTNHEINRISLLMGLYLCCYGVTQVLGMIFIFPRLNKKIGLFYCGVIGCTIFGAVYCLTLIMDSWQHIFIIYVGMALGNSISRPIFPSYLGSIAGRSNRADYMAISATFGNVSLMIAGQMTVLYTINRRICILLCGLVSLVNAAIILLFSCCHKVPQVNR